MHFEFLVEGQTELTALSILMKSFLGEYGTPHTWRIHKHRGIGKIPSDPRTRPNRSDQSLLHNLPSKLRAYGKENRGDLVVVVLVDLDDRPDCIAFKQELISLKDECSSGMQTIFRIAIEELEAWFLGDKPALEKAYPNGNFSVYDKYKQDSQCGTWEVLAELVHTGGLQALMAKGKRSVRVLEEKRKWAAKIAPEMDVTANQSPSFCSFRDIVQRFAEMPCST
jgi:hypothetical protein